MESWILEDFDDWHVLVSSANEKIYIPQLLQIKINIGIFYVK